MINFKKALLAGTAIVAVGSFGMANPALAAACADPTVGNCEISADPGATLTITDGHTATIDTTITLSSDVESSDGTSSGTGILATSGTGITVTQTGDIGTNPNELASMTVAATDTWVAQGNIDLTGALTINGNFNVDAPAAGIVIASGGVEIGATGVVTISDTTTGTANFADTGDIDIATGGVLTINDTAGLTLGAIDGNGAGQGTVNFNEGFTLTNAIGGAADLAVLNIAAGVTLDSATFGVDAVDLNIANGAALVLGGDTAAGIDFTGATGTVTIEDGQDFTGTIDNDSGTAGRGTLVLQDTAAGGDAASIISSNVGATARLAAINLTGDGTATFQGTVAATTITTTTGTLDFDGATVTGNINLAGAGTVQLATGTDVTGAINNTSGADGAGTLTIVSTAATNTITGAVGASNSLATVTLNGTGGTGVVEFDSTVNADAITLAGAAMTSIDFDGNVTTDLLDFNNIAGTVDINANLTGDVDFGDAAGTLNFADGSNFTGTISDTADDEGTVNFAGASTVTGNIGDDGDDAILAVNFNGGAGKAATVSGLINVAGSVTVGAGSLAVTGTTTAGDDINVGTGSATFTGVVTTTEDINFTGDGTVTLSDAAHVIGDDVLTGTDSTGTLVLLGGGTITDDFAADTAELKALTMSAASGETLTVTGAFEAADTTTIRGNTIAVTGTVDFDAAQTLAVSVTGATTSGQITAGGAATVDAGTLVNVSVDTTAFVANGQTFTVIDGTGGGGVADLTAGNITDNSFLLSFTQVTADNDNLILTAARTSSATVATGSNNIGVATVLEDLGAAGDATLDQVQGALNSASTQAEVDEVLESVAPPQNSAAVMAGFDASTQSMGITSTRLASLRNGSETGMVAGEIGDGVTAWMQGFAQTADQGRRDGIDGYESDTFGFAVGADTQNMHENMTVGIALSYANTDVESENANTTDTDVDSYQVSLYGDYDLDNASYAEGLIGFARNNIDQTRHNVGTLAGVNATADYDSDQYMLYAETGREMMLDSETKLTPHVLANYQYINVDDYTETGAGGASLSVDNEDLHVLQLGVGAEVSREVAMNDGSTLKPAVHAEYRYDLIGDAVESTSTFTGGGASFKTEGMDPAQSSFNIGASLGWAQTNNWEFTANYDFQYKSDYDAHAGYIRAGYKF